MQVVSLVTGDEFLNDYDLNLDTKHFYDYLKNITFNWNDDADASSHFDFNELIGVELSEVITSNGFCHSFNIPDSEKVFFTQNIANIFNYHRDLNIIRPNKYNLFGYTSDATKLNFTYPIHTQHSLLGFSSIINLESLISKDHMKNIIHKHKSLNLKGYNFYLHNPYDYVSKFSRQMRSKLGSTLYILISPKLKIIEQDLKYYEPTKRGCYLQDERSLQFFKNYTKSNCQFECLANMTLTQCNCVQFFMVRTEDTRICGLKDMKCYKKVEEEIESCGCLIKCGEIEYNIEVKENDFIRYLFVSKII